MKKVPRITINRIELCKQPKSGAFRTAILAPFHRLSSVFGFDSPAAKNIRQTVYKMYGSHHEDLNTRHFFMLPDSFVAVVCNVWGGYIVLKRRKRGFLKLQESHEVTFSFFPFSFIFLSSPLPPFLPSSLLLIFPSFLLFLPSPPPFLRYQRQLDVYLLLCVFEH